MTDTRPTLVLAQGIDSGWAWPIVDGAGAPADLTGYTAAAQIRRIEHPDAVLLTTLTAAIDGSNVVVSWTAEESLAWEGWSRGAMDVILIDPMDRPKQIVWQGTAQIDQVVTHA